MLGTLMWLTTYKCKSTLKSGQSAQVTRISTPDRSLEVAAREGARRKWRILGRRLVR